MEKVKGGKAALIPQKASFWTQKNTGKKFELLTPLFLNCIFVTNLTGGCDILGVVVFVAGSY